MRFLFRLITVAKADTVVITNTTKLKTQTSPPQFTPLPIPNNWLNLPTFCSRCYSSYGPRVNIPTFFDALRKNPPQCPVCGKRFKTPALLQLHWKKEGPESRRLKKLLLKNNSKKSLANDHSRHGFTCPFCFYKAEFRKDIVEHKKYHCPIKFKLSPLYRGILKRMDNEYREWRKTNLKVFKDDEKEEKQHLEWLEKIYTPERRERLVERRAPETRKGSRAKSSPSDGAWRGYSTGGYRGFYSKNTITLTPKIVNDIHKRGGTIIGTSRGGHDTSKIVDSIQDRGINQVYIIGGDGTQKGAAAIYKVIDRSFGFDTAVEEAQRAINAAHVEAESAENGIGVVKLMGRYCGFIAMYATLASRDVDCCLIPESPFYLEGDGGLFEFIEKRLKENGHMVIVIAEGAGQELLTEMQAKHEQDASGNKLLQDVGLWISQRIKDHFAKTRKLDITLKYIDPTYMIRAIPSYASDNVYCTLLAQSAVHGAMAGYTVFTVGLVNSRHTYIPFNGLSFSSEMQKRATKTFSGGWRMRVALARALFIEPDILLLDEPTNHLDLHAVLWLETYLVKWPKTFIVVSHAREFLNTVVTDIIHLQGQKLITYRGNYDIFERTREEHLKNQQKAFEANERSRAHMQTFIDKFRYNAKRASLVQSRIKALDRLGFVDEVINDPDYKFEFPSPDDRPGPPIISFSDASFGYPGGPLLFKNLNFGIDLDSRVAMVGPNGIGKSTILKLISGELQPTSGTVFRSAKVRIAVFSQHHVDGLDLSSNPLLYMMRCFPGVPEQKLRAHLGSFGITGNLALQPMYTLSGGQKSRVAFSKITFKKPHILLLDEPSNHLDLDAVEALIQGLVLFQGGVLMVSHDEHLISGSVEQLWVVSEGRVSPFNGTFHDYKKILQS